MKLVIVESPKKAKTIEKYLGREFKVRASGGHVCDLPQRSLGIDIDNNFKPEYVVNDDKKKTIEMLKSEIAKSEAVYLATDPDREGEAISWHLKNELGLPDAPIRIEFHEISQKAVNNALSAPRNIDINLVNAQQARRVLDRIVGYKISPIISKKIKSGLSAGRVQSAALKMLVDKEKDIRNFKPEEYWTLHGFFKKDSDEFKAIFEDINEKKHKIKNKDELDAILTAITNSTFTVDKVKKAVKKESPKPPFTTSTLQQDATARFSMTAPQVMSVAQQLYEGVEIEGEGHLALVTYIRTDSVRVSDDAIKSVRQYISNKYAPDYLPKTPNSYKTSNQAQDAHEAIRPISLDKTPESLRKKLSKNLYQVYKLIYDRFVASQMTQAQYNTLDVRIGVNGTDGKNYGFHMKGRAMKFPGFTAVYSDAVPQNSEEGGDISSPLNEGDLVTLTSFKHEQKFTKPPQRYTESSLIKAMEDNGIGRPSTYASIINVLAKREYYEKDGKYMVATNLGEVVCNEINKNFSDILDLKFTAKMESGLDEISLGKLEWQKLISDFYPGFMNNVRRALSDGTHVKLPDEVTDIKCEKCGAFMVIKEGKMGKFLACPNYPRCKNTRNLQSDIVGTCPKCKRDVVKKVSRTGKVFYGCSGYPSCDFASWDIPAPYFCPDCGSVMKVFQRKGQKVYKCTKCEHKETIETK